jgi:cadmium resistance protein CadD (predicted permease)
MTILTFFIIILLLVDIKISSSKDNKTPSEKFSEIIYYIIFILLGYFIINFFNLDNTKKVDEVFNKQQTTEITK